MILKSTPEMSRSVNNEEVTVWLSTTMIQALRNMITLFTHYFESLENMLDRFLDLLALCICQDNDTIARIGSNCLQQLILQNVTKFKAEHWTKIVGSFVHLFERTTAHQLFSAATSSSEFSSISEAESGRKAPAAEALSISDFSLGSNISNEGQATPRVGNLKLENKDPGDSNKDQISSSKSAQANVSSASPQTSVTSPELEDYRPQSDLQQQPEVVTVARRRLFNRIISRCILQLLMIETVNELFSNDAVYAQIPSSELLRLMSLLKSSYSFAKKFNNNKDLRMRLWKDGFMKQPPNLLKQESGSAATYISILVRMYHDDGEERKRSRAETEAALIPLVTLYPLLEDALNIMIGFVQTLSEALCSWMKHSLAISRHGGRSSSM